MTTVITQRPGKFQTRVEINWNDHDPWDCYDWCKKHIGVGGKWIRKFFCHSVDDDAYFYFYFKQPQVAVMFMLRWA